MGANAKQQGRLAKELLVGLAIASCAVVFVTALPSAAQAQTPCPAGTHDTGTLSNRGGVNCVADAPTGNASGAEGGSGNPISWLIEGLGGITMGAILSPVAILAWAAFKIGSLLLGLAGILFNWVMIVVVFRFADFLGNSPGMLTAWGILRDFGNIALIFGFVYIGIRTILDIGHFSTGKSLAYLIVAAVLMNFSLFAAEAVVDTSNVLSSTLYEQSYNPDVSCIARDWLGCAVNNGIAGQLLSKLGVTTVFGAGDDGEIFRQGASYFDDPLAHTLKYIGLALLVTVAAMVLFAGAIMLISRGVILAFLMVTSPIGLAGMAVPPLKKLSDEWWDKLIKQAFFAPAFLLLLLVSLKMTDGLDQLARGQGGLAAAISSTDAIANTGPLILFALVIGFMIGSLMLANKFGIYFSDFATTTGRKMSFGLVGMAGRHTVGATALRMREDLLKKGRGRTPLGRFRAGIYDWAAKGNYDGTSNKAVKNIAGIAKIDLGHAQHGGFDHVVHETEEKNKKYGQNIENTAEEELEIETAKDEKEKALAAVAGAKTALQAHAAKAQAFAIEEADIGVNKAKAETEQGNRRQEIVSKESAIRQADAQIQAAQRQRQEATSSQEALAAEAIEQAARSAKESAERELDTLKEQDEARTTRENAALNLQRKTLAEARKSHEETAKTLADQVRATENLAKQRTDQEAATKDRLKPERIMARQFDEDLKSPVFQLFNNADGVRHAKHSLEKYAGLSTSERTLQKLVSTMQQVGDKVAKEVDEHTETVEKIDRLHSGDNLDDRAHGDNKH